MARFPSPELGPVSHGKRIEAPGPVGIECGIGSGAFRASVSGTTHYKHRGNTACGSYGACGSRRACGSGRATGSGFLAAPGRGRWGSNGDLSHVVRPLRAGEHVAVNGLVELPVEVMFRPGLKRPGQNITVNGKFYKAIDGYMLAFSSGRTTCDRSPVTTPPPPSRQPPESMTRSPYPLNRTPSGSRTPRTNPHAVLPRCLWCVVPLTLARNAPDPMPHSMPTGPGASILFPWETGPSSGEGNRATPRGWLMISIAPSPTDNYDAFLTRLDAATTSLSTRAGALDKALAAVSMLRDPRIRRP